MHGRMKDFSARNWSCRMLVWSVCPVCIRWWADFSSMRLSIRMKSTKRRLELQTSAVPNGIWPTTCGSWASSRTSPKMSGRRKARNCWKTFCIPPFTPTMLTWSPGTICIPTKPKRCGRSQRQCSSRRPSSPLLVIILLLAALTWSWVYFFKT